MVNEIIFALFFFGFLVFCFLTYLYYLIFPVERKIIDYRGAGNRFKWCFRVICGMAFYLLIVAGIETGSLQGVFFAIPIAFAFMLINYLLLRSFIIYRFDLHTNSCLVLNLRDQVRIDEESAKLAEQYLKERIRLHRFLFFWRGTSINEIKREVFPEGYEFGRMETIEEE